MAPERSYLDTCLSLFSIAIKSYQIPTPEVRLPLQTSDLTTSEKRMPVETLVDPTNHNRSDGLDGLAIDGSSVNSDLLCTNSTVEKVWSFCRKSTLQVNPHRNVSSLELAKIRK